MKYIYICLTFIACVSLSSAAGAQTVMIVDGGTSVLLDTDLLSTAAGLDLSGVSNDVGVGNLGASSVLFDINPRDAADSPTTFAYTAGDFAPFAGTIEHSGSVFFNNDTVEVGDFSIGFDANRVDATNSGFFVESTTGVSAILFDVGNVSALAAETNALTIEADLLVSPEFASFLGNSGLTGADVGDTRVDAVSVPEPGVIWMSAMGLAVLVSRRQRKPIR